MSYTTIIQDKLLLTTKKILYAVVDHLQEVPPRHKHHYKESVSKDHQFEDLQ